MNSRPKSHISGIQHVTWESDGNLLVNEAVFRSAHLTAITTCSGAHMKRLQHPSCYNFYHTSQNFLSDSKQFSPFSLFRSLTSETIKCYDHDEKRLLSKNFSLKIKSPSRNLLRDPTKARTKRELYAIISRQGA